MGKTKYHFDLHSLSIQKVTVSIKERLFKVLWILSSGMVFSVIVIIVAYNFLDSPKEKKLSRELEQYKLQYKIMNTRVNRLSAVIKDMADRDDNIYRAMFETDPIPGSVRNAAFGGADLYAGLSGFSNSEIIKETARKIDDISRQAYVQSKSFDELFKMVRAKEKMMTCLPAIQPVSKNLSLVVSGFGYRIHPIYKTLRMHTGIDFSAKKGTPVYATGDGVIISPHENQSGYGIVCMIYHGFGYETLYAHLSKMVVRVGKQVKRGQLIGYVGSTGLSVAPHCHYEVIKDGRKINPINFFYNDLTPEEYEKVIELASKVSQSLS